MAVEITYTLGARGVARFDVKDTQADTSTAYRPTIDDTVTTTAGGVTLFAGNALRVRDRAAVEPRRGVITAVDAVDYVRAFDARIVTKSYPAGQTLKQVVSDLRTTYLAVFGITLDAGMADGPTLEALDFNGVTVTAILNQLSDVTGWVWRVLPTKVLEFFAVGTKTASYSLTSSNATIIGGVEWTKSRGKFVNRQWVKYGTAGERQVPESFIATAGQSVFVLGYPPLAYSGTVNVGGTLNADGTITGGSNETASYAGGGGTWVFDLAAKTMTRTSGLSGGTVVNVIYPVQFPLMVSDEDAASVAALGPWEDVAERPDIFDKSRAQAEATGLLRRYTATPREITVSTRAGLVFPGDVITLTLPERTVTGSWLITAVRITSGIDQRFSYDLTCLEGTEAQASWIDYWRSAVGGGGAIGSSGSINGFGVIAGGLGGTGTVGTLPVWATTTTQGDSIISQSGSVATVTGTLVLTGTSLSIAGETIQSGTGSPEGAVTAMPGSLYMQDDGAIWRKASGSGNTGWVGFALSGTGTTNTLAMWTGATAIGNSLITQDSGNVVCGGHVLPLTTDTYDLGRYDRIWNQGYLAQLNAILFSLNTQTLFGGYSTIGYNAGTFPTAISSVQTEVNFGQAMTTGHFVQIRGHDATGTVTAEYMQVGALVSGTNYVVTRNLSGLGAKAWPAGMAYLVLGTTGTARIDLLAYDGKPRIAFVEQGATYNAQTVRGLIGNINGYFGYSSDIFGAAFGTPTAAWIKIDPTNGVRIGHNTTTLISLNASGSASFSGSITSSSGTIGGWSISSTLGITNNSNVVITPSYSFFTGGYAGRPAMAVAVAGSGNLASLIGGTASSDIGLMVGGTDPGNAPFRVTFAGALTCTGATVSGALTATSGNITAALQAGSITASHIASGTITATQIAAGTITADKLNVTSLSAITANIGSITTGSMSGVSVSVAGGLVLLNSDGLSLTPGGGTANKINWSTTSAIWSSDGHLSLDTTNNVRLIAGGQTLHWTSTALLPGGSQTLGTSGSPWASIWSTDVIVTSLAGGGTRNVGVDNNGKIIAV